MSQKTRLLEWAIVVKGARKHGITASAYVRLLIARDVLGSQLMSPFGAYP